MPSLYTCLKGYYTCVIRLGVLNPNTLAIPIVAADEKVKYEDTSWKSKSYDKSHDFNS